jgi:hypothetical protein
MVSRIPLLALAGALALAGGARAADMQATGPSPATTATSAPGGRLGAETPARGAGVVTPLGEGASAVTYWVDEPEGFRVVTTVAAVDTGGVGREDRHAVFRLSTILQPGQTQTISVPGPEGSSPFAMRIRRLADGVEVVAAAPEALTN